MPNLDSRWAVIGLSLVGAYNILYIILTFVSGPLLFGAFFGNGGVTLGIATLEHLISIGPTWITLTQLIIYIVSLELFLTKRYRLSAMGALVCVILILSIFFI